MAGTRKTPQDWISAGFKALKQMGPAGLRAETLAREIGTTKGSFYWHFKDVPAFQSEVLASWTEAARTRFDAATGSADTTVLQLRSLANYRPTPLDIAVRAWSVQDKAARKAVDAVDAHMLKTLSDLLQDLDATHPDFPGLIHAALIATPKKGTHVETLVDLLLVLK